MATITALDYRRSDLRTSVLGNPYWISSGLVSCVDSDDKGALIFSFPTAGEIIIVQEVVLQVVTAFTANTVLTVGSGSLATDAVTTGGDITIVDADEYLLAADITIATPAYYGPTTANTSDWLTACAAGTYAAPRVIVGAATTVPCVYIPVTNAGAISAGTFRVHMLISKIPA